MDIFMRQWWYDPRFKSNFSIPFNIAADPTVLIWTPDTYFWNVKKSKYHSVTRENMRVMIWPDGKIYFSARCVSKYPSEFCYRSKLFLYFPTHNKPVNNRGSLEKLGGLQQKFVKFL